MRRLIWVVPVVAALGLLAAAGLLAWPAAAQDSSPLSFSSPSSVYVFYTGDTVDEQLPTVTGGTGAITYSISPTPDNGLSFNAATHTLSGTVTAAAPTVRYVITATDGTDQTTTTISVTVIADLCSGTTGWHPSGVTPSAGLVKNCNILLSARDQLRGSHTAALTTWDTGTSISSWQGFDLYFDGSGFSLLLASRSMDGSIPPQLGGLSSLQTLVLHENQLTGEIPVELGNLDILEYLYLYDNRLTGQIPAEFAHSTQFKALAGLNLYGNSLTTPVDFSVTPAGPLSEWADATVFTAQVSITDPGTLWAAGFNDPSAVTADLNLVTGGEITAAGSGVDGVVPVDINPVSRAFSMDQDGTITGELTFTLTPTGDGTEQDDETVTFSLTGTGAPGGTDTSLAADSIEVIVQDDGGTPATTPTPTPLAGDRAALEALYYAAGGDDWTDNNGWLTDEPLD